MNEARTGVSAKRYSPLGQMILARVRDCFASLWGDRAVLYRHHQGFSQKDVRMAVVVQRQVECDRAGVGFSLNPVSGRINRLVIDANYGLGESVVSGECEVDHFELDKRSLQIVERSIGHKEQMVAATPDGVQERSVPPEWADRPCLDDDRIGQIARLLEDHPSFNAGRGAARRHQPYWHARSHRAGARAPTRAAHAPRSRARGHR